MAKAARKPKQTRNPRRHLPRPEMSDGLHELVRDHHRRSDKPFEPKTPRQADYAQSISTNVLTFGVGPAGTGKTFIAVVHAAMALVAGEVDEIVFTRPAQEAGEELGFLPGEIEEKVAPWFAPLRIELEKRLGKSPVEHMIKVGKIRFMPFAFMRGHSLNNAFIVLDEAQNTTPKQMELLLSRVGEGSIVVVDGDLRQQDTAGRSGLEDALWRFADKPGVGVVEFQLDDIVRSGFCRMVIESYRDK